MCIPRIDFSELSICSTGAGLMSCVSKMKIDPARSEMNTFFLSPENCNAVNSKLLGS